LNEDSVEAWTDPETGKLWLRDFLPKAIPVARILTYGYDASASSFYGSGCAQAIQRHANGLVVGLQTDRSLEGYGRRPIIFVCHGLGGVLVKKAIAYSSSRTSPHVSHLYDIFVSTYAILFFGTSHGHTDRAHWLALESIHTSGTYNIVQGGNQANAALDEDSKSLQLCTEHFTPLMKQFHVYFFWEELPTNFGQRSAFVVEESSAAPILDDTERSGISATHSGMVKFSTDDGSSYRTVMATLRRYCKGAPRTIARRWEQALEAFAQVRWNESFELAGLGFDVHLDRPFRHKFGTSERSRNKHFYPPQEAATDFIGREDMFKTLELALFSEKRVEGTASFRQQKRFVVYGMGGSGKTEFCSQFARDYKER
jgi:hypothetical protein